MQASGVVLHNVYLVDSNELFCEGLKRILQDKPFEIIAMADSFEDLLSRSDEIADGSIILIDTAGNGGQDTAHLLAAKARLPAARFVVLTSREDKQQFARFISAGVDGYLMKTISADVLAGALHLIALGEKVFPSVLAVWLLESMQAPALERPAATLEHQDLSKREIDILGCLAEGLSNKMIARRLQISDATVKVHVKNVLKKMNAVNRTQAAIWALKNNIAHTESIRQPILSEAF